jgi:hypothetical protein
VKVGGLWAAAIPAGAGLVAVIAFTAVSSADGAPRGSVLASPAKVAPTLIQQVLLGDCSTAGGAGPSSVRVNGPCGGLLTGRFACVRAGEFQAISIRRPVGRGRVFYLTIVISEFEGPGEYSQDVASAQVTGPVNSPRWTSLGSRIAIHVTRDGVFELGQGVLLPEPGTPASGVIALEGRAVCR